MITPSISRQSRAMTCRILALSAIAMGGIQAFAATDLSDFPLSSASSGSLAPNILFILDDSGSMGRAYMPDEVNTSRIGMRNHLCNTVYYNPATKYVIPKDADGTDLNSSAQTAFLTAYNEGFHSFTAAADGGQTNLSTSFSADGSESGRAAYYWQYLLATAPTPAAGVCNYSMASMGTTTTGVCCSGPSAGSSTCSNAEYPTSSPPSCTAGKTLVWQRVLVGTTSGPATADLNGDGAVNASDADERQNFANWYSYYRERMQMMKSASGRAFQNLTDSYRIGFMTIHPGTFDEASGDASGNNVTSAKFLGVANFDSIQRTAWYTKLYSQATTGSTPLRPALSAAGRYFAGKNDQINQGMIPATANDPVQYSCQQNFAFLTTDGYWNGGSGRTMGGTGQVGNQDGNLAELDAYNTSDKKFAVSPRPIYDGAVGTFVWNTAHKQYRVSSCALGSELQRRTVQYQQCSNPASTPAYPMKRTSSNGGASWTPWSIDPNCTTDNSGTNRTECQAGDPNSLISRTSSNSGASFTAWAGVATCVPDTSGSSRTDCSGGSQQARTSSDFGSTWSAWSNVASCTPDNNGRNQRECRFADTTLPTCGGSWVDAQCTNADPSTLPLCRGVASAWAADPTCTAVAQDATGLATECQTATISGSILQYRTKTAATTYPGPNQAGTPLSTTQCSAWSGWSNEGSCSAVAPAVPSGATDACPPVGGDITTAGPPSPPGSCTTWPCEIASSTGGSSDSLSDVAQYYFKTDLRTSALGNCTGALGSSVCSNNVSATGSGPEDDKANWQHMTTFTMGLGLDGTVIYSPTYRTDSSGDFSRLRGNTPVLDWPVPSANDPTALDDLWHAAVNGRGQYFSAKNPDAVIDGVETALSGITARVAASAAAATSNLEPVAGDNFAYTAKYITQRWTGDVEAREINLASGAISGTAIWSAATKLAAATGNACDTRNIKLFRAGATDNLVDFTWNTFACDGSKLPTGTASTSLNATEQAHFDNSGADTTGATIDEVALLSQYPNMSDGTAATVDQRTLARGANLVNFLRGQRGREGFDSGPPATTDNANRLYRSRDAILGDIINAQPIFVRGPFAEYAEDSNPGYAAFKAANASRIPMVYIAANDGMLHAFRAGNTILDTQGGTEAWAFIPTTALPNLYLLANETYATDHRYFVDGTPTAVDVFDPTASVDCGLTTPVTPSACWKTILVAGLNKGGKGYYALDITTPEDPKGMWEFKQSSTCISVDPTTKAPTSAAFSDCHLGYTYNNPVVGKLADGRWVVVVTSGYNNDDGIGYLYVLNAITGEILYRIETGVGTSASPSGLNHINAWTENALINNVLLRVYGVDLLGNVWRFDINDSFGDPGREATLLAQVLDSSGLPQSITTRPELALVSEEPFIYVGTGRYLGSSDLNDTQTQTVYAIRDPLTTATVTNLRSTLGARTIQTSGSGTSEVRTLASSTQCESGEGWFIDLPTSGERVNIDPRIQLGTLVVASNVPSNDACTIGGFGYLNFFDNRTGCAVSNSTSGSVGVRLVGVSGTESLAVGTNIVRLPSQKTVVIVTTSAAEQITLEAPFAVPPPVGKRVSWREVNE